MQPQENPYQFITDANHPPKKSLLPGGNSVQGRIVIFVLGLVGLIIVGIIVMSVLSSGGKATEAELLKAAQQQTELIRISKVGIAKARDPATKNLAVTTNLTLQSDQSALLRQTKLPTKQIVLGRNNQTDVELTTAEQSNRFDEIFTKTLLLQLAEYQKSVKNVHDSTDVAQTKAVLANLYNNAGLLATSK